MCCCGGVFLTGKEEIKKSKIYGLHGRGGYHLPKVSLFIAPPLPTNPYLCAIYEKETVRGEV